MAEVTNCSFCGRSVGEVSCLVTEEGSLGVAICDHCIDAAKKASDGFTPGRPKFVVGDLVEHLNSEHLYRIIGTPENYRLEADGNPAYAYQLEGSRDPVVIWVRSAEEMEDGRFRKV